MINYEKLAQAGSLIEQYCQQKDIVMDLTISFIGTKTCPIKYIVKRSDGHGYSRHYTNIEDIITDFCVFTQEREYYE